MKIRIGILAFSDGREYVYKQLKPINQRFLKTTVDALRNTGEIEPIMGDEIIWTSQLARAQAEKVSVQNIDGTIFNFSTWSFPNLAVIAAQSGKGPHLMLSNLNPQYPGLVAMLASAGALDQLGLFNERIWGDISKKKIKKKVLTFCRAAHAVNTLKGQTFGLFGGRSFGMNTATADPLQWQKIFGVDVEHIDQLEIIRGASQVSHNKVETAFKWLTKNVGRILYDNNRLTKEKLKFQIRCYEATKAIIKEKNLNFVGIKCHTELSDYYVTQCLSQAFLNDPYDWDGEHNPVVCACEADMDGGLTMQILNLLSQKPVLFMDFRHYDEKENVFVFCNCGSHATWYAARSNDPRENLKKVIFYPSVPFFPGGGAHVQYVASEGEVTLARLSRKDGKYWMAIALGRFIEYPREKCEETSRQWPHAFVKLNSDPNQLISEFSSNHVHAVSGNFVNELVQVCRILRIKPVVFE